MTTSNPELDSNQHSGLEDSSSEPHPSTSPTPNLIPQLSTSPIQPTQTLSSTLSPSQEPISPSPSPSPSSSSNQASDLQIDSNSDSHASPSASSSTSLPPTMTSIPATSSDTPLPPENPQSNTAPYPYISPNSALRLRRGTRLEDAYPNPFVAGHAGPDPSAFLHSIESPFQVQEYIALLVRADPHDVDRIITLPSPSVPVSGTPAVTPGHQRNTSTDTLRTSGPLVPQEVWIYEQLRRFSQDLSHPFVSALQNECARVTCPEMKAGEWLYLCAAHATANENDCCAIDYIVHTLDGATALLNSARYFPSRLQIPGTSIKHFTSIARRLYRIFAHAWFHHREIFEQCETETSLYARFLALTDRFALISEDLLVIPRALEEDDSDDRHEQHSTFRLSEHQSSNDDELEELE